MPAESYNFGLVSTSYVSCLEVLVLNLYLVIDCLDHYLAHPYFLQRNVGVVLKSAEGCLLAHPFEFVIRPYM
jgi:hypothetical protein